MLQCDCVYFVVMVPVQERSEDMNRKRNWLQFALKCVTERLTREIQISAFSKRGFYALKSFQAVQMYLVFVMTVLALMPIYTYVSPETLKSQVDHEEEKCSKMKQLLVKTKKDLADAKKQVCVSGRMTFFLC